MTRNETRMEGPTFVTLFKIPPDPGDSSNMSHLVGVWVRDPGLPNKPHGKATPAALALGVSAGIANTNIARSNDAVTSCLFFFMFFFFGCCPCR